MSAQRVPTSFSKNDFQNRPPKHYFFDSIYVPKSVRWAFDLDQQYIESVRSAGQEVEAWLARFEYEFTLGQVKKGDTAALHNTDNLRRDCWNRRKRNDRDYIQNLAGVAVVDDRRRKRRAEREAKKLKKAPAAV